LEDPDGYQIELLNDRRGNE
ncbi:hypothetical protein, partial [Thiolapillus sp.]